MAPPKTCGNKSGVVWHNDAGEKDETVFTLLIGMRGPKWPVFLPRNPARGTGCVP
jgi:hypothetical protein